jgi:hypothetical protein
MVKEKSGFIGRLCVLIVLGACGKHDPAFKTAATDVVASATSITSSSSAQTFERMPPASVEGEAAPDGGRCGVHHEVEVANYFVARGLDVSVAVEVDCTVLVSTTNAPQEVLDWLKSRPYRIHHIDSPAPEPLTG